MKNDLRRPLSGDQIDNERLITGYPRLSQFLTSEGFPISTSSLQKIGAPSAGGNLPIEGYWGNLPVFRPSRSLDWARSRIRPTRGKPTAPATIADSSGNAGAPIPTTRGQPGGKGVPENNACATLPAEVPQQHATIAESVT